MDISRLTLGAKKIRFYITNGNGETLAWFDNMQTAAAVLRYLKGSNLTRDEIDIVMAALKDFDEKTQKEEEKPNND